jgi:hypothetical protein
LASRSGGPGVRLRASHELTVIRPEPRVAWFEAIVTGYNVAILDPAEGELLAYHWHQGGTSNVRSPHLHIAFGGSLIDARLASKTLSRLHLPTGPVASGAIVRFLIEDLGIEPIRKHWRQTLERDEDSIA